MLTSADIPFSKMLHIVLFPYTQWVPSRYLPHTIREKIKSSTKADTWWHTNASPFST
jgi:hypothetical protein